MLFNLRKVFFPYLLLLSPDFHCWSDMTIIIRSQRSVDRRYDSLLAHSSRGTSVIDWNLTFRFKMLKIVSEIIIWTQFVRKDPFLRRGFKISHSTLYIPKKQDLLKKKKRPEDWSQT